ncbi:arabinogalactan endo-1,4-beta-galactosidase [Aquiflexum balticum DSM 16537]|uniref:Arabinogalactan endo-beta-1,4-galactanase n=1 Tax=Aquiflexum balticum DSM 16537 TaxID=758820 RepID=A0A1W2H1L8_9BACT|nr:glycosyl hydrolase 53 family protein [Aquiflexum balticum]SMD42857.1 arabinogalactan endo-1,4-beta-galactosidase [Aquiflexum balticum DSM 16537]
MNFPRLTIFIVVVHIILVGCQVDINDSTGENENKDQPVFYFGSDLSYINQILDKGGVYKVNSSPENPYRLFAEHGNDLVRLRLWHNPTWTSTIYGDSNSPMYNDLLDVERAIASSKEQGMKTMLDFHYSDIWADPGRQEIPEAWKAITDLEILKDSVYQYTFKTLKYLDQKGLMPEFVQIGNETNCGMMYTDAPEGFPKLNVCEGNWSNFRAIVNSSINAIRDASAQKDTKIIFHVADPVHVDWWFENLTAGGLVRDFDIIGFSYYPIWHTGVPFSQLFSKISSFRSKFGKDIMMLETAYPWTAEGNDDYTNIFGGQTPLVGYPFTKSGQLAILKKMTQELISAGAIGIIYWEPAWISSPMKDLWGTGSSWENCTFFDFTGNLHEGIDYMLHDY